MKPILIIEGVSCTGKTTVCRKLELDYGFTVAHEGVRYLEQRYGKPREQIMGVPHSLEDEQSNQDMLFEAEAEKLTHSLEVWRSGQSIVLDKSALAIMASAYAFEQVDGLYGDLPYAISKTMRLLDGYGAYEIIRNSRVALLTLDHSKRVERRARRGTRLDDTWLDDEVTKLQERFLRNLIEMHFVQGRLFSGDDTRLCASIVEYYEG